MPFIKGVYVVVVAAFIALLVGFGIAAFYPSPPGPDPPRPPAVVLEGPPPPPQLVAPMVEEKERFRQEYREYEKRHESYRKGLDNYRRRVFFLAAGLGLVILASSFFFIRLPEIITSGMLLGGLFAYIYGVAQAFGPLSFRLRFAAIAVGLGVLIYLGLRKLRRNA